MYERILVPTDGSPDNSIVAAHAAELAATTGGTVYAVHVVDESELDVEPLVAEAVGEARREAGNEALEQVEEAASGHGVEVHTELRRGVAHREIVDYADEIDADVIVMGTHGRQGLQRYVMGSVTEHVLRTADQPVLAVKLDALAVGDEEAAEEAARDALVEEGDDLAELRGQPYRERSTWVVPATTDDGRRVNVHVDARSGDARVARLD